MRMRRIRNNPILRRMVQETHLEVEDFIAPVFVVEGEHIRREIPSMKGCFHFSVDRLEEEVRELESLGIRAVLLFGLPGHKDACGSEAYSDEGIVQRAVRKIRSLTDKLVVITDVCMCEYTSHGHCGLIGEDGLVENDATVEMLAKIALSHARAGAHIVAPSDMMDLRVGRIREELDAHGYQGVSIMAYSAKFASHYYGPFREAAASAPSFGDRRAYQMDYHNGDEALREIALDLEEGADFVIVKPALGYLDILARAKERMQTRFVAYSVSGEYAMLRGAVDAGLVQDGMIYETHVAMKRAGASMIITYFAKELARKIGPSAKTF